jgi:hypothetical protein
MSIGCVEEGQKRSATDTAVRSCGGWSAPSSCMDERIKAGRKHGSWWEDGDFSPRKAMF